MSLTRRDFMKLFGVTVASLLLTRCRGFVIETPTPTPTCYAPLPPPTITPSITSSSVRERLRSYWLRFGELSQKTISGENPDNALGQQMIADHRATLDELVTVGEISTSVADLVQESYDAAVYHVWRSNAPITCYEPMMVDYAPSSAGVLVKQSEILNQIAAQGTIDPATLAGAQAALEHDMAFYDLSAEEIQALYDRLIKESQAAEQSIPTFEALQLELTPDAREAAHFILDLLTGK
jgi:hypothetical protein